MLTGGVLAVIIAATIIDLAAVGIGFFLLEIYNIFFSSCKMIHAESKALYVRGVFRALYFPAVRPFPEPDQ